MQEARKSFAVLIDGDNAQPDLLPYVLKMLEKYGDAPIRRVYGDWLNGAMAKGWEQIANRYLLEIVHKGNTATGKNGTDIAMVIDAMDLLHEQHIESFCIVSSDSDFSHLAVRLRKKRCFVIGVGRDNVGDLYKDAFDVFVNVKTLHPAPPKPMLTPSAGLKMAAPPPPAAPAVKPAAPVAKPAAPAVKPTPSALIDGLSSLPPERPLDEFRKLFLKAYQHAIKTTPPDPELGIQLVMVRSAMIAFDSSIRDEYPLMPRFVQQMKRLASQHPNLIALRENTDTKPLVHYVIMKAPVMATTTTAPLKAPVAASARLTDLQRLRQVYDALISRPEKATSDGWISLSPVGDMMRKMFPSHDPFTYNGVKYSKFKQVIEQAAQQHPGQIELRASLTIAEMRMKR